MNLANSVDNNDESVWLVVHRDQRYRVFELPPSGDGAVVFGASSDANVKLPGAAPIALHVERDADGIWLTPGYADPELRVDGQRLGTRRRMHGRAVVESSGVSLVLQVRDTPPTVRGGSSRYDDTTLSEGVFERQAVSITAFSDTTVVACMATSGSTENATREYSRAELAGLFPHGQRTDQLQHYEKVGTKTEELNAYKIRKSLEHYNEEPTASQLEPPRREVLSALRTTAVLTNCQNHPSGDTTTYDGAAFRQLTPVTPTATTPLQSQSAEYPEAVAKSNSSTPPLMTRLGLLAKEKPLHVLAGAAFGSLFLVVFMVGVANLASGSQKGKLEQMPAPRLSSNVVAKLAPEPQASIVAAAPAEPTVKPTVEVATAIPTVVVDRTVAATDASIDSGIQVAVGHLFSGRSAEAEQAYRELAAKHTDNVSYATIAKVLARRNSPDCRSAVDSKKSCPKVMP